MTLTPDDLENILTLIDFHINDDDVKEVWDIDIEPLRDKILDLITHSNQG